MPKAGKGVSRKQSENGEVEKRIVVLDQSKCKPTSEAFKYLKRHAGGCGKPCIQVNPGDSGRPPTIIIWENACGACITRAKKCPDDAVQIVKLPTNLTTDTTHRYGQNSFKLHGLPTPRPGSVHGLLGTNGIGKSTALKVLAGRLKPNLGRMDDPAGWEDIIAYYRGSDLQNFFTRLVMDDISALVKPQMDVAKVKVKQGATVADIIADKDQCGRGHEILGKLDLLHLMDRDVLALSGGEMQRLSIACTAMQDGDVFMFDEPSSFLDVKQRLAATEVVRGLLTPAYWGGSAEKADSKYVIVVEHDLAVLDYMSDQICCLYGQPGVYGVVTQRLGVGNGVNQFLAGYFPSENMRFRPFSLDFRLTVDVGDADGSRAGLNEDLSEIENLSGRHFDPSITNYPKLSRTLTDDTNATSFTLHVEAGVFHEREVICMLGENGMGKTTFMKLLAGRCFDDQDVATAEAEPESESESAGAGVDGDAAAAEAARKLREKKLDRAAAAKQKVDAAKAKIAVGEAPSGEEFELGADKPKPKAERKYLRDLGISFKRQHNAPRFRKFKGNVQRLLEKTIQHGLADRLFRLRVLMPLGIDKMENLPVSSLSGGEMQRVAIAICLGTPAQIYLLDEPSAGLDCEQRIIVGKVIKRWCINHLNKTVFVIEHDFLMATALADRVIVFRGEAGIECTAGTPVPLLAGMNTFLRSLDVTFRRDPDSFRPRINKKGSTKDREQKLAGEYYVVDNTDDSANRPKAGKRQ